MKEILGLIFVALFIYVFIFVFSLHLFMFVLVWHQEHLIPYPLSDRLETALKQIHDNFFFFFEDPFHLYTTVLIHKHGNLTDTVIVRRKKLHSKVS